jgi:serine protease Do
MTSEVVALYVSKAGDSSSEFKVGDRIVNVDGTEVKSSSEFKQIIDEHKVGDTLSVVVYRGKSNGQITLTLK